MLASLWNLVVRVFYAQFTRFLHRITSVLSFINTTLSCSLTRFRVAAQGIATNYCHRAVYIGCLEVKRIFITFVYVLSDVLNLA